MSITEYFLSFFYLSPPSSLNSSQQSSPNANSNMTSTSNSPTFSSISSYNQLSNDSPNTQKDGEESILQSMISTSENHNLSQLRHRNVVRV